MIEIAPGLIYLPGFYDRAQQEALVADLRADVFAHLARLDPVFYDTAQSGELVSRLTADTTQMKSAFGSSASTALRNFFMFIGAIGMMIVTSM